MKTAGVSEERKKAGDERERKCLKRGEGGDLRMLTWWALERSCGCKGPRGADPEFHSHCLQRRGIRQCMEALACKEKLCRLCRKLSPRNFKKGLY